jgi:AraC-like DNA-binding protein
MSPIQFQKQIRLQEARLLLIADRSDVAGVAYAVGYESPSQFSPEYRRRFGMSPGRDAARLRDPALAGQLNRRPPAPGATECDEVVVIRR